MFSFLLVDSNMFFKMDNRFGEIKFLNYHSAEIISMGARMNRLEPPMERLVPFIQRFLDGCKTTQGSLKGR